MKKILTLLAFYLFTINSTAQGIRVQSSNNNASKVLLIGGVAFTAAALLETGYSYGTFVSNQSNATPYNSSYVKKPFWKQTPRNIMLVAGVSFTITGLLTMNKK